MAIAPERFFADIEQHDAPTSKGPCAMPILYRDASLLGAFFRVDPAAAGAALAGTAFEPYVLFGKAVVLLACFEYRDTTVGTYNEVGLAIQAKRRGSSPSLLRFTRDMASEPDAGLVVTNLPVTTGEACAAGVELWSYPKYVTGIETDFRPDGTTITLQGELRLTAPPQRGPSLKGLPFVTWTSHHGRLLRTVVKTGHDARWGLGRRVELEVLGAGPTADTVEALGMAGRGTAVATFRTDRMLAILPHGIDRGADETAAQRS